MMTPTLAFSALDTMVADALARQTHFMTFTTGGLLCRICSTFWPDAEAWAADSGVCPGYVQCGQEPAMLPSQPHAVGPAESGRG